MRVQAGKERAEIPFRLKTLNRNEIFPRPKFHARRLPFIDLFGGDRPLVFYEIEPALMGIPNSYAPRSVMQYGNVVHWNSVKMELNHSRCLDFDHGKNFLIDHLLASRYPHLSTELLTEKVGMFLIYQLVVHG